MKSLSSTLARTLASAVVTAAALGGCSMMCGARGLRRLQRDAEVRRQQMRRLQGQKCGACGAKK